VIRGGAGRGGERGRLLAGAPRVGEWPPRVACLRRRGLAAGWQSGPSSPGPGPSPRSACGGNPPFFPGRGGGPARGNPSQAFVLSVVDRPARGG